MQSWWKITLTYQGELPIDEFAGMLMAENMAAVNILDTKQLEFFFEGESADANKIIKSDLLRNCQSINLTEVIQENWVQNCAELFTEVQVRDLKIIPLVSASDRTKHNLPEAIYLIPGMGFGSGHHPTSQMILELMQNINSPINTILDCGTGSGILSIAASKLFEAKIKAFDNDAQAIINARENIELNPGTNIELSLNSVEEIAGQYDLILANLYLELLKRFKNDFLRLMHSKSILIISGITANQANELTEFYKDLELIETREESEWCAYKFIKI